MLGWLSRLALILVTVFAGACASGAVLGAASAETQVTDLLVTCLSCGEHWLFTPSATLGAGLLSLFRRRRLVDKCPKCGSREVAFGHTPKLEGGSQRRIS
jgi:ribosomal protein S27E